MSNKNPKCQRIGGCLGIGYCCCDDNSCDHQEPTPSPATDVDEVAKIIMCGLLGVEWQKAMPELSVTQLSFIKQSLLNYGEKLRGEVERLEQQSEKDEHTHLQTIDERYNAEQALSHAYYLVTGESPEWSNNFGYNECHEGIHGVIELLKQSVKDLQSANKELKGEIRHRISIAEGWEDNAKQPANWARNFKKENEQLKALIVRKDEALKHFIKAITESIACEWFPRSVKLAKEALSPTISSSLVEDKERLDWIQNNCDRYDLNCNLAFGTPFRFLKWNKEVLSFGRDLREAIDAARNSSKTKIMTTCIHCGTTKFPLYRTTPIGTIPANWTCWECLSADQRAKVDTTVKEIVDTVANDSKTN